jgi:hypothetical protein
VSLFTELSTHLYEMAAATKNLRHKRYLLEEGRRIAAMQTPEEIAARLAGMAQEVREAFEDAAAQA